VLERLRRHLSGNNLIPAGSRVLLGYSGGADSTCLLHLLNRLEIETMAGHLHHGQRPEADEELEMCHQFALEVGSGFISGQADVPRLAREMKIGLEEAGRKARYAFLEQAARHYDCQRIATAHTRTDHVETVLHHLARGCGLPGLAGIPEKRGTLIRPILIFDREETRAYCVENSLPFHDDPANSDCNFSRARIRHRILPELQAINPSVAEAITRMSQLVSEENRFLNGVAASALERAEHPLNGALGFLTKDLEVAFRRDHMAALPDVVLNRAIRLAVETLGASLDNHETETLSEGIRSQPNGSVTADGGKVVVEWSGEKVHVRELLEKQPFRSALTFPGETVSEDMGWKLTAFLSKFSGGKPERNSLSTEVGMTAISGSLYFRSSKPADFMQPIGFKGHRKISDLLGDAKLSQAARARLPIVCDMVGPIWIPGICVEERVRPTTEGDVAVLRFEPA
jgi:tRNA(Ile)-lysidine synthase